jgi:HTH-type transcriptional regulator, sugar sensing transcriptional regulator
MIPELKELGLNEYESKAYAALAELGQATGRDIAKKANLPKTRIFDVLRSLSSLGLISLLGKKPMIWSIIRPEVGIKSLVDEKIASLTKIEKSISKKFCQIKAGKPGAIHEDVVVITGYEKLFFMLNTYLKKTEKEYNIFSVGEDIPYTHLLECKRAIKRGVKIRLIATKYDDSNKMILKKRIDDRWEVRYLLGSGSWTFAVLDEACLINVRNPLIKDERITIFFENSDLSKALNEYYKQLWKRSNPI